MSEPNFSQLEIDLVRSYKYACEQLTLLRQYAESLEAAAAITPRELSNLRDDLRRAYALERQRAEAAQAERARLVALLEGLTPGGSEFQGDPIRCAAWITDRLAGVVRQVEKRKAAEAQLAAVPDYASYYTTAVQLSRISGETPMTFAAWLADAQPEVQP